MSSPVPFHHAIHAMVCDRIEPWEHGTAVFVTRHPTYRVLNCLRVEDAAEGVEVTDLVAVADRLQASLTHRAVEIEDEPTGTRLRPGFDALGWATERLVWMGLEGQAHGGGAPVEVSEVPFARTTPLRATWFAEEPSGADDGTPQFLAAVEEVAALRGTRALLAWGGGGEPVGYVTFTTSGDASSVDEAWVQPHQRGAGIGAALVSGAVAAAGTSRTWIVADDERDAKRLYARLGFEPAWIQHIFTRLP